MEMEARHKPVMVREVLAALDVRAGGAYIDSTAGEAGHSLSILGSAEPPPFASAMPCRKPMLL